MLYELGRWTSGHHATAVHRDQPVRPPGRPAPSRQRPAKGWDALTETERRVVDLVAEGLIYREVGERMFISRCTVETHIAHVFAKLGVSNRRELEAAYAEREASMARSG
ncbi:MAG: helix-turn-helix transcriptional regulator [Actinobacteria bacterium]|nr:helix-turn-helix transcriptional regulator [Actinomycetota bacterium]